MLNGTWGARFQICVKSKWDKSTNVFIYTTLVYLVVSPWNLKIYVFNFTICCGFLTSNEKNWEKIFNVFYFWKWIQIKMYFFWTLSLWSFYTFLISLVPHHTLHCTWMHTCTFWLSHGVFQPCQCTPTTLLVVLPLQHLSSWGIKPLTLPTSLWMFSTRLHTLALLTVLLFI